jgi:hypothetical protein
MPGFSGRTYTSQSSVGGGGGAPQVPTITLPAPSGGVVEGWGYVIGDAGHGGLFGVASVTASEGEPVDFYIGGTHSFETAESAWMEGEAVYWVNAPVTDWGGPSTVVPSGSYRIGVVARFDIDNARIEVRLDGVSTVAVP